MSMDTNRKFDDAPGVSTHCPMHVNSRSDVIWLEMAGDLVSTADQSLQFLSGLGIMARIIMGDEKLMLPL